MAVDGTLEDVPDTPASDAFFGRPTSGKRGDGDFPQVRKLSLVEVGTHIEFALCTGSYHTGEKTMFPELLPHLHPEMLLLFDRKCLANARNLAAIESTLGSSNVK